MKSFVASALTTLALGFDYDQMSLNNDLGVIGLALGTDSCWIDAYGRGVGKPLSACRGGEAKDGLLCYPVCNDGYYGVGPVCW